MPSSLKPAPQVKMTTALRARTSAGLRLSFAANLILLVAVVALFRHEPTTPSGAKPTAPEKSSISALSRTPLAAMPGRARARADIRDVITRLQQAGISRSVLADILRLDFRQRWTRRIVELENRYAPRQPPTREYIALQRQQDEAQIRELKAALGDEGYAAWDKEETLRKVNFEDVPLTDAENDQLYRLQKQFDDKIRLMQMAMEDGDADIADMGTLQMQAQDAYEKGLQNLLGETRYNQLKGYTLPVVDGHLEFNELSPSAEQITALKSAESDYQTKETELARKLRNNPSDLATVAAELATLTAAREDRMRDAVGADAYDQLKLEHDDTYQTLNQFSAAWNLTDTELAPVYQTIKTYVDNVDRLRKAAQMTELAGQTADWKTVNAVIEQSRQQTEAALQKLIGSDRAGRIARNGLLSPLGSDRNTPHPPGM